MKIDRHNYEEYFLLFIDNELTVDQKKQVELFVKENPDLEEELVMLQQSRLIPDKSIVFNEKQLLIKEENNSFINMSNYEEWLVLYVDNELSEEQKVSVERFAATHSHVQQELDLFQQVKLQPEKLLFADKDILYRTAKPKVVVMQWWRVAVAAILILAVGITFYSLLNTSGNGEKGTAVREVATGKKQQPATNPNLVEKRSQDVLRGNDNKNEQVAVADQSAHKKAQATQPLVNRNIVKATNKVPLPPTQQTVANRPMVKQIPDNTVADKISEPTINDALSVDNKKVDIDFSTKSVTSEPAETLNTVEVASNTENKRFRGFFRKATRLIERTTNINPTDDDNRVLIGGVAINLK